MKVASGALRPDSVHDEPSAEALSPELCLMSLTLGRSRGRVLAPPCRVTGAAPKGDPVVRGPRPTRSGRRPRCGLVPCWPFFAGPSVQGQSRIFSASPARGRIAPTSTSSRTPRAGAYLVLVQSMHAVHAWSASLCHVSCSCLCHAQSLFVFQNTKSAVEDTLAGTMWVVGAQAGCVATSLAKSQPYQRLAAARAALLSRRRCPVREGAGWSWS